MSCRTIYDFAQSGFLSNDLPRVLLVMMLVGIVGLAVLAVCWVLKVKMSRFRYFLGAIAACVLIVAAFAHLLDEYRNYRYLSDRLKAGQYASVSGEVTNYQAVDLLRGEYRPERFTVAGLAFLIDPGSLDSLNNVGFQETYPKSPIRPGLRVRIDYIGGVIVRIEQMGVTSGGRSCS